jgi:hypothetical protein
VIAVVIVVLAVLVITAVVWARVSAARSEHKSVETYEHALGVLGEVSKRTESTGFRILPHEETGRPHVGRPIDPAGGEAAEGRKEGSSGGQGPLVSKRLPPAGQPKLRFSGPTRPADRSPAASEEAGEDTDLEAGALAARTTTAGARPHLPSPHGQASGTAEARARSAAYRSTFERRRQVMARRAATGVAAAAAVAAVVVAGLYLSGSGGTPSSRGGHGAASVTGTTAHHSGGGRTKTTSTTTTKLPTSLQPTSVSPVTFTVPSREYKLAFQATGGRCWVGIEHTTAGPWLFAQTLAAGQSVTFKGSGTLIVRFGAPPYIALRVNGLVAALPSGVTAAYSVDLTPAST